MTAIRFYFDPICPFAWLTSGWVRQVRAQRELDVEWRLISLRKLNINVDYDEHFPPEYLAAHTAGLQLLRVAAAARAKHGPECLEQLQRCLGSEIFDQDVHLFEQDARAVAHRALNAAGLSEDLARAFDDSEWDAEITAETEEALALTGRDVGTPIIQFDPPAGPAFFGPVISRLPAPEEAVQLWDHVEGLARFPSLSEFKRSLRERPQLRGFGVDAAEVGVVEDWHQGSRRLKK